MHFEVKKALYFPFNDEKSFPKLAFGYCVYALSFIINLIVCFSVLMYLYAFISPKISFSFNMPLIIIAIGTALLTIIILSSIIKGYFLQSANNEINNEGTLLPEWRFNISKYCNYGIKALIITSIYNLAFISIILAFTVLFVAILYGFVHTNNPLFTPLFILLFYFIIFISLILMIPFIALKNTALIIFAERFKFCDAFRFNNFKILLTKSFLSILLISFLVISGEVLINSILSSLCIGYFLLPLSVIYIGLVNFNLIAQIYKNYKAGLLMENENNEIEY